MGRRDRGRKRRRGEAVIDKNDTREGEKRLAPDEKSPPPSTNSTSTGTTAAVGVLWRRRRVVNLARGFEGFFGQNTSSVQHILNLTTSNLSMILF